MDIFKNALSSINSALEMNESTLSGTVDVIVVKQKDGSYKSTGFHVRFGKFHVLRPSTAHVTIDINGHPTNLTMKLGEAGEGYFEEEVEYPEDEFAFVNNSNTKEDKPGVMAQMINSASPKNRRSRNFENNNESDLNDSSRQEDSSKNLFSTLFGMFSKDDDAKNGIKMKRMLSNDPEDNVNAVDVKKLLEESKNNRTIEHHKEQNIHSMEKQHVQVFLDESNMDREEKEQIRSIRDRLGQGCTLQVYLYDGNHKKQSVMFSEVQKNPKEYLLNKNLATKIDNTVYNYKLSAFILAHLLSDPHGFITRPVHRELHTIMEIPEISHENSSGTESNASQETDASSENEKINHFPISSKKSLIDTVRMKNSQKKQDELANKISVKKIVRSLRLDPTKLESLGLHPGHNTITYNVHTPLQGHQQLTASVYLWSYNTRIIVTDVDGTLTKSDVLGAILPVFGKDWSQPGIAPLFDSIKRNGYEMLYLTSRAIGQNGLTRDFVAKLKQDETPLPEGPVVSSPDRLYVCFKREIILSQPEFYKAAALKDIQSLFPSDYNPFYAAFGNRENDAIAYRYVGIPLQNIFTVNPSGDVYHHADCSTKSYYSSMNAKAKELFPCLNHSESGVEIKSA